MELEKPKLSRWRAMVGGLGVLGLFATGVIMAGPLSAQTHSGPAPECAASSLGGRGLPTTVVDGTPSLGLGFINISRKSCSLEGFLRVQTLNKAGKHAH